MTTPTSKIQIPEKLFFRIGDVAQLLEVKPHVLRYWESEFSIISPQKSASGQRVYRKSDVETLLMIKHLLHEERYSIEGAKKRIRELRRDGELRNFKRVRAGSPVDAGVVPPEQALDAVRSAADALLLFVRKPLSELFSY